MHMKDLLTYIRKGKFYEAVVELGSDIIFIVDFSGIIRYHNASVRSLGYRSGGLINKSIFDLIPPETRESFQNKFRQSQRKAFNQKIEFQLRCKDNTYRDFEFNSINLTYRNGPRALILDCRDITQRKKDAAELLRLQKAKEQFMANISHDIRTPVNGIAGMAELLAQNPAAEEREIYLNAIRQATSSLCAIVNDLLDLSVIESGKLRFEAIPFNPAEVIQNLAQMFSHQVREKNLEFSIHLDESVNRLLIGDPARLNQILNNLLSNAVKFTQKGSITITADIIQSRPRKCSLRVSVKDTGVGIPADKIETIFESFSQADTSVTRKYGGTGLGLTIVRQLTELQNGTVHVKSREHAGSEFTIIIPYKTANKLSSITHPKTAMPTMLTEGIRVLLVEDNDVNRLYTESILKSWKCMIRTAGNGEEAIEIIKAENFDVVLMDVQMPVMDGITCTQIIRQLEGKIRSVPIVALTANATRKETEKCIEAGMNTCLTKPFTREELYLKLFHELKIKTPSEDHVAAPMQNRAVDLSYLRKVSGYNEAFVTDIIQTFLTSTPSLLKRMEESVNQKNWTDAGRCIHQIKPSLGMLGMRTLQERASRLEEACKKKKNIPELRSGIIEFVTEIQQSLDELRQYLQESQIN
jgi:PAS domain S-box-containing protein